MAILFQRLNSKRPDGGTYLEFIRVGAVKGLSDKTPEMWLLTHGYECSTATTSASGTCNVPSICVNQGLLGILRV